MSDDWTDGGNWSGGAAPSLTIPAAIVAPSASDPAPVIDGTVGEANMLFLGSMDHADLTIRNGGQLNANNIVVGNSTNNAALPGIRDESGAILLTGTGSGLSVGGLTVGYYGDGTLNITDGATATVSATTSVGLIEGTKGTVTVSGAGSLLEGGGLYVGGSGEGEFNMSAGASAQTTSSALGINAGSNGVAVIAGQDTSWTVTGSLSVGSGSTGDMTISDGAAVSATGDISIGRQLSGSGTLTVSGENSQLTTATNLFVGFSGEGDATIRDGATMSADKVIVGFDTESSGTLVVDGANSLVRGTSYVMVGYTNDGEATISNGGTLKADGARGVTIAFQTGSTGTLNIGAAAGESAAAAGHIDAASGIKFGAGSGRLVLNHTDTDYVLAGPISGIGAVDVLSGTTIFSGDSSLFSGSFTVDGGKAVLAGATGAASTNIKAGGVLQIGNGGTSGSLNSDIVNDGALVFNRSDALLHNRVISGSGGLTVSGGTITLSGMNTFTGATNIEAGATLALSGQGRINQSSGVTVNGTFDVRASSSAQIRDLDGNGTVIVGSAGLNVKNASQTFAGQITGTGGLMVEGGTLTLTGASSFENGLGISNGATVKIGAGGTTGSITSNVTNFGTLVFDRSDDISYAGQISGQGTVIKTGANTATFTGAISGTQLNVAEGTAVLLGTINSNANIADQATLVFARPTTTTYRGVLSGTGSVVKSGAGTTIFSGNSSGFGGDTTIEDGTMLLTGSLGGAVLIDTAGTLQVGDGVRDGNLLAGAVNNGTLIFSQIGDYDYTGALAGNGNLIKRGTGTLLLSGDYSYTGSTVVEGGVVRLTSQLDTDSDLVLNGGVFDLGGRDQQVAGLNGTGGTLALGTGELTVIQNENSSFAGEITGTGGFIKGGSGSLNLTGTSSFTGQVDVNDGRLAVNGTLPGQIAVNNGGTLGGTGTTGTLVVNNGGTLAPGNSVGTLNVAGNVQFNAGSVFEVEVDAAGNGDRVNASGAATINGGMVSVIAAAGAYRWTSDYVILTAAGGVTGTFAGLDVDLPFLTPYLGYGANAVTLTLVRNDRSFASVAGSVNQRAVAVALDGAVRNGALYRAVAGQADAAGAAQAFDALSGELWETTSTFMVDGTRRLGEMVIGRMDQADTISHALSNARNAARQTDGGRTGIWGQALGSWNTAKSDGNAAAATQNSFGFITGIDTMLGDWRVGVAFNHGEDKVQIDDLGSRATVTGSAIAAYVGGGWGKLRARVGGSYGWQDVKGERNISFPGVSEQVSGEYNGKSASAFAELSYAATLGKLMVEPFAGANHVRLKTDGFDETGGALTALTVGSHKRDVTYTTLGLRLGAVLPVSEQAVITPRVSAAWLRGFGDVAAEGRHKLATGESFSIEGMPATRNALRLEAGLQANILPGGSLGVSYVGNMADRWSDHGLKLGFSYSF
ncbi:autotransporter domain-containing protein [Sphingopyxis sp. R3-92]|uniref:autotransporter outer membrane beta-barrel domain-containing protein n=1 Tax=Sphingopyxis sp. R3-92 TaxID=3158553 RepID=UPI003EE5F68E